MGKFASRSERGAKLWRAENALATGHQCGENRKKNQRQDWKHVWINAEYRAATYLLIDLMWKVNSGGSPQVALLCGAAFGGLGGTAGGGGVGGRSPSLPPPRYLLKSFPPPIKAGLISSLGAAGGVCGTARVVHPGSPEFPSEEPEITWRKDLDLFYLHWFQLDFYHFLFNFKSTTFQDGSLNPITFIRSFRCLIVAFYKNNKNNKWRHLILPSLQEKDTFMVRLI